MKKQPLNAAGFPIWRKAAVMAAEAHIGQNVRTSRVPYIIHPVRVAMSVQGVFGCADAEVIAAAVLHDVLEKTILTSTDLQKNFGPRVTDIVERLSKNTTTSKKAYWERLHSSGWEARLVKMGDALDHLECPPSELPRRIKSGYKALALGYSREKSIRQAGAVLAQALQEAEAHIAANPRLLVVKKA